MSTTLSTHKFPLNVSFTILIFIFFIDIYYNLELLHVFKNYICLRLSYVLYLAANIFEGS